jgi:F1F0 ATPase subunit 2
MSHRKTVKAMAEIAAFVLAPAAGFAMGIIYWGGLWLTVRQLPRARHPVLLMMGSYLGRTAFVLAGFYLVMGGQLVRLMLCLLGFIISRIVVTRRLRPKAVAAVPARKGSRDGTDS